MLNPLKVVNEIRIARGQRKALGWFRANELARGGIRVHSLHCNAYQEVSGYIVPTLLDWGEEALAKRIVNWLLSVQCPDGAFSDPDQNQPYVFDTAQVLRGLIAARQLVPGAESAASRAADYLCAQMVDEGRAGFGPRYNGILAESMHLYCLPPLVKLSDELGVPRYRECALRCLGFYSALPDCCALASLTHFLAYEMEALIDLGRADLALPVLAALQERQKRDGSVRAKEGVDWVCLTGLAQIAICWYKTGNRKPADLAVAWLARHQKPSGGFLGSEGAGATYFPSEELSWAVKYFLDAVHLRQRL